MENYLIPPTHTKELAEKAEIESATEDGQCTVVPWYPPQILLLLLWCLIREIVFQDCMIPEVNLLLKICHGLEM